MAGRHHTLVAGLAAVLVVAGCVGLLAPVSRMWAQQNQDVSIRQLPGSNEVLPKARTRTVRPKHLRIRQLSRTQGQSQARVRQVRPRPARRLTGRPEMYGLWGGERSRRCKDGYTGAGEAATSIPCRIRALHAAGVLRTGRSEQALIEGLIRDMIISSEPGPGSGFPDDATLRFLLDEAVIFVPVRRDLLNGGDAFP